MATTEPSEPVASPPEDRDQERARIAELLKNHAPPDWEERFRTDDLLDAIIDGAPIQMFVMAADIRESTTLMKEAIRFDRSGSAGGRGGPDGVGGVATARHHRERLPRGAPP